MICSSSFYEPETHGYEPDSGTNGAISPPDEIIWTAGSIVLLGSALVALAHRRRRQPSGPNPIHH
jgi:hypothetical protein